MGNTFGSHFQVTTFGESHGEALGCIVDNCPAGLELTEADIQPELDRRRPGQSKITTPRKESDTVKILSGTFEGKTLGTPIAMVVYNENAKEKDYSHFKEVYRPSHADYTYDARYGYRSYRGGARASARSTIGVVAAGAVASKILQSKTDLKICAYVSKIHDLEIGPDFQINSIDQLKSKVESHIVRCPDHALADKMQRRIQDTRQQGDSIGGVIRLLVENVPAGLGNPVFDRIDALLAHAMIAIPATKGVEIGSGFKGTDLKGSEHNDEFYSEDEKIRTRTNFSGGIQGGISNGEMIDLRIAFKPTATISQEQKTVNKSGEEIDLKVKGRHDPCVLPRAVPIVEAFASLVLCDQWLQGKIVDFNNL